MPKQPAVFPKLFIGTAYDAFKRYLTTHKLNYDINYLCTKDELAEFIERFSHYKSYTLPVIIADISFFNAKEQSMLLKFMDDTSLNLILLASRDNILPTIISRVKEFRKYYANSSDINFFEINKAREMLDNELKAMEDYSYEDKLITAMKYNPLLSYNDSIVSHYSLNDRQKLLSIIEF